MTKAAQKQKAQEMLMDGIGNVIGYWREKGIDEAGEVGLTDEELDALLWQQASRVAKLFGYEKPWSN